MEIIGFILVSIGLIIVPGPNVLAIVSASISYGKVRGLQTVAGTSAAMLLQLSIAALGTNLLVKNLVTGFFWLKWLGVSYLIYLGINHLLRFGEPKASPISAIESFQRGFWISLTNPKTILFFCAFFPQFTDSSASYLIQIAELSAIFWLLAIVLDSSYAILADKILLRLKSRNLTKCQHGFSGVLYLGAGAVLAVTKRT